MCRRDTPAQLNNGGLATAPTKVMTVRMMAEAGAPSRHSAGASFSGCARRLTSIAQESGRRDTTVEKAPDMVVGSTV
jgi:hypothetical protein